MFSSTTSENLKRHWFCDKTMMGAGFSDPVCLRASLSVKDLSDGALNLFKASPANTWDPGILGASVQHCKNCTISCWEKIIMESEEGHRMNHMQVKSKAITSHLNCFGLDLAIADRCLKPLEIN